MKYRNTKTGVIIDVPCKIRGGDWVEHVATKKESTNKPTEEYIEEEINLEEMTKAELIELAKEYEIKVSDRDTKTVIIEAISKAFE